MAFTSFDNRATGVHTPGTYDPSVSGNPIPPTADEIQRLRIAVSAQTQAAPEVQGMLATIAGLQTQIGRLLNQRAAVMDGLAATAAKFAKMQADAASAQTPVNINFPAITTWLNYETAQGKASIANIDGNLAVLQNQQRAIFDICTRYVPSF